MTYRVYQFHGERNRRFFPKNCALDCDWRWKSLRHSSIEKSCGNYKKALLEAGHELIEFVPEERLEAADIITKMWSADGGQEFQRDTNASGEPLHPQLEFWLGHSVEAKPMTVFET